MEAGPGVPAQLFCAAWDFLTCCVSFIIIHFFYNPLKTTTFLYKKNHVNSEILWKEPSNMVLGGR